MRSHNYSSLSDVNNFLSNSCIRVEYKDILKETVESDEEDLDENMCDFDDIEEVFGDHILMGKRFRKTLYAGDLSDLEDPPNHPPIALTGLALELFSKAVPNNGLDILDMDYVSCTTEAARITPCAMIVAMIYLERLQLNNLEYLEIVSPSGLFVVTMLVASKFLFEDEDDIVTNQIWAEALNFDIKELNELEREFLAAIDWKILVDSSDYFDYLCRIEKIIAMKQSSMRNWLSYSDVCSMLQDAALDIFWAICLKRIVKTMVFWTVGYVATAITLHTAGIAFNKLVQQKNVAKTFRNENATTELNNYEVETPFHYLFSDMADVDEKNCESEVPLKISWEEKSSKNSNHKIMSDACNLLLCKGSARYSSDRSRDHVIDKLRKNFDFNNEQITVNYYNSNIVHYRPKVKCFSLLM